jgi:hypothetical protein
MATPVLTARKRHYRDVTDIMLNWLGVLPLLVITQYLLEPVVGKVYAPYLFFALCGLSWVGIMKIRSLVAKIDFTQHYSHIPSEKVLFVRAPGDEASLSIGAAHVLSLLTEKAATVPLDTIESMIAGFKNLRKALLSNKMLTFTALAVMIGSFYIGGDEPGTGILIYRAIDGSIFLVVIAILIPGITTLLTFLIYLFLWFGSSVLLFPMILLASFAALALGPELAIASVTTYMTAEVCPPGQWTVLEIPSEQNELGGALQIKSVLQHSLIYESENALHLIRGWLAERISDPVLRSKLLANTVDAEGTAPSAGVGSGRRSPKRPHVP